MIATFWSVPQGPWPEQVGPDVHGFRSAADTVDVMDRRLRSGEAGNDDRTRYRIASATLERAARMIGMPLARVDADDLLAWMDGHETAAVHPPQRVHALLAEFTIALDGSGALSTAVIDACQTALTQNAGLVITLDPGVTAQTVVRAVDEPNPPVVARTMADPKLADQITRLPRTADLVFANDRYRLRCAAVLRRQIQTAVATGEPLSVGSQAKHDVLTEVLRELHHPDAPSGSFRIMYATEACEGEPFRFGPLTACRAYGGKTVHLGLMSIRHTDIDADVSGYWFRNRLVSVPGRTQADSEAYCCRDSIPRLRALADRGVTDIVLTHTGYEPAALGFYRAVAAVVPTRNLRVHPRFPAHGGPRHGTPWPSLAGA